MFSNEGFNTTLVRFKLPKTSMMPEASILFQYYFSSIQTWNSIPHIFHCIPFQYYFSSIQTVFVFDTIDVIKGFQYYFSSIQTLLARG